jgi:hypothetical protein
MLIDPVSENSVTVGGPTCLPPPSLATPAGIVCVDPSGATFKVLGWDGKETTFSGPVGAGGVSLSTDGRRVATTDATGIIIREPDRSSTRLQTPGLGYPGEAGWIDQSHFVYRITGTNREAIYDITRQVAAPLAVGGELVARLPGGL